MLAAVVNLMIVLVGVRALTTHPAFSMSNPNRVRALIGAFAQLNQKEFNRADGAGYEFVMAQILALDANNPQVASRLSTAFRSWRTLEPARRARAQAVLQNAAAQTGLSRAVRDIVSGSGSGRSAAWLAH